MILFNLLVLCSFFLFIFFIPSPSPENRGAKGHGSRTLGIGEILFRSNASFPSGMHLGCTWVTTYFLHSRYEFMITSTGSSAPTHACLATFLADRLGDNFRNGTPAVSAGEILLILLLVAIFLRTVTSYTTSFFLIYDTFSDVISGIATWYPAIRSNLLGLG